MFCRKTRASCSFTISIWGLKSWRTYWLVWSSALDSDVQHKPELWTGTVPVISVPVAVTGHSVIDCEKQKFDFFKIHNMKQTWFCAPSIIMLPKILLELLHIAVLSGHPGSLGSAEGCSQWQASVQSGKSLVRRRNRAWMRKGCTAVGRNVLDEC